MTLTRYPNPQLYKVVAEVTAALHAVSPSYQTSVCVAWSADAIDGRAYDYKGLADAASLLYIMDYGTRSQILTQCIASANAPLPGTVKGIQSYLNLGIPASKLLLGIGMDS